MRPSGVEQEGRRPDARDERLPGRHALLLESVAEGICGVDLEGRITFANPAAAAALGYAVEELVGQSHHELVHHSRADGSPYPESECPVHAACRLGEVVRVRAEEGEALWRKDGTCFPVKLVSAPVREGGEVVGAAVLFSDVTDRLRRRDERETMRRADAESEKLATMGTLVSGVAHEVRTPLTALTNNAFLVRHRLERARQEAATGELARALLPRIQEMEQAVERLDALVDGLRRFSRLEETRIAPMSLEEAVAEAAGLFQAACGGSVRLELDLEETLPVMMDAHKVQQVVLNLLENAADADAGAGGAVRVRTRMDRARGSALLVVEDEGRGMPEEVQGRMYEPLFTTKEHGTGLGLAIVRRIAEEHGATVSCRSAPGRGTTFTVAFPPAPYE